MPVARGGCICARFATVTEAAAIAAIGWLGRGDAASADLAARGAMAAAFEKLPIRGRVVAGRGNPGMKVLSVGSEVGRPGGPWASSEVASADATSEAPNAWDIAVDPLQAPNALARGMDGAFAMIAAGPAGSLMPVPEMYMQKLVVPSVAADVIDLDALICDNLRAVATALGRKPSDLTVVVLDRPRHERLIEEVRQCGARVKLIGDGDVSAALAVPSEDDDIDVCVGIGGSTEGILTAAALRCIGGEIQARFWPTSRIQVDLVQAAGILDLETRLTARDMAGDGVLVAGTAITRGRFLREVTVHRYGARTHSLVLCTRCGSIQKIEAVHLADPGVTPVPLGAE